MEKIQSSAEQQARAQLASIVRMVRALHVDYSLRDELRDACAEFVADSSLRAEDAAYKWRADNPEAAELLADLEDAADGCESEEDARERIQEDPLSVEVRSGWQSVGEDLTPAEFCILLCTGGPAVRIVGELDDYREVRRCWLEYQDWGTPWTQLFGLTDDEARDLEHYASSFYFGG